MNRRKVTGGMVAGAFAPSKIFAQQYGLTRRAVFLVNLPEGDQALAMRLNAFRQGLEALGWYEGRNLIIDYRFANADVSQINAVIALRPEVVLVHGTPTALALRASNIAIPTVFLGVSTPVEQGLISNLSRPGNNMTGFLYLEASLGGKWIELLKLIAPGTTRTGVIFNPQTASNAKFFMQWTNVAARKLLVEVAEIPVGSIAEIEIRLAVLASNPGSGLICLPDTFTGLHRKEIFELAARFRLPTIYSMPNYVREGGLISYGVEVADQYRQAATYVDRILKGEHAGDLPVQSPTKFQLGINLKTASTLNLAVSDSLLLRADEVIE